MLKQSILERATTGILQGDQISRSDTRQGTELEQTNKYNY